MRLALVVALSLAATLLCAGQASADPPAWGIILDAPQTGPNSIQFFDESHGIGTAGGGGLLLTEDGGRSWREIRFAGEPTLKQFAMEPSGHVWLMDDDNQLLHSADKGLTWEAIAPTTELKDWLDAPPRGFEGYLLDLSVVDATTVWVVGGACHAGYCGRTRLFRSLDAGRTWTMVSLGENVGTFVGRTVFLPDGKHIWVSTSEATPWSGDLQPLLLHSGDGGDSWERFPLSAPLRLLYFSSPTEGRALWCATADQSSTCPGGFSIIATSDGGRTWRPLATLPSLVWASEGGISWNQPLVDPVSGQEAWIVSLDCPASGCPSASSRRSVALHTLDGGQTWETKHLPFLVNSMDFVDGQRGVLSTSLGVLMTKDGLQTWEVGATPTVNILQRVVFVDDLHGWGLSGWALAGDIERTLMRTDDGGRSWRQVQSDTVATWKDIDIIDRDTAWATAACWTYGSTQPCLLRLRLGYPDEGSSQEITITHLEKRELQGNLHNRGFDFVDASTGWVRTGPDSLARSRDGGATWQPLPSDALSGLQTFGFLDGSFGWAVGGGSLLLTEDGGQSWVTSYGGQEGSIAHPSLGDPVQFVDRDHGWASGGPRGERQSLLRTVDGGKTWSRTTLHLTGWINAIDFEDPEHGVATIQSSVAEKAIVSTDDGGETWREELRISGDVFDVCMLDEEHAWVSAAEGSPGGRTILYATGVPTLGPTPTLVPLPIAVPGTADQGLGRATLPSTGQPYDNGDWPIPVCLLIGVLLLSGATAVLGTLKRKKLSD